ncbi:uncharacterized protein LOC115874720 [Sitophilus oryzae]|uniref:Uncharacterized protein LOC115874720 n=1 Tax=Sitophilus oryzae TaxID=7048 RepID=A0A6J2X4F9_SITOR|nr:uncharacterized protein LOC115874720 [Sitophilus oryzae]
MKNQISLVDFVILQFLWFWQSAYESFISIFNWSFSTENTPRTPVQKTSSEKRHFIRFFTKEPTKCGEEPVCYIHVTEINNPHNKVMRSPLLRPSPPGNYDDLTRFYCGNLRY